MPSCEVTPQVTKEPEHWVYEVLRDNMITVHTSLT